MSDINLTRINKYLSEIGYCSRRAADQLIEQGRVTINGEVKIPGRFETNENETLSDLLFYAGGLSEKAYKQSIKLTRIIDGQLKIVDINYDQFDFFKPSAGDVFQVDQIIEKYNNRVIVNGAVYRPGTFSLTEEMTVKNLIDKAEGLKTDVFFDKAYVTRTNEDYSTSTIALNLRDELKNPTFILKEEDVLNILSINDLSEENYIEISGQVEFNFLPYEPGNPLYTWTPLIYTGISLFH